MVRRLEIAQARCIGRASLLDEPTVGLIRSRATRLELLVDLRTNYGTTLF